MAIEVVVFHVQPDVTSENFQAAVDDTTALLQAQTGFKSRTVGKAESGEWLDIIHWDSVASAKKAMTVFQRDEAGQRFSSYLDLQTIQVYYLEAG